MGIEDKCCPTMPGGEELPAYHLGDNLSSDETITNAMTKGIVAPQKPQRIYGRKRTS